MDRVEVAKRIGQPPMMMSPADRWLHRRLLLLEDVVKQQEKAFTLREIAADGLCSGNVHVFINDEKRCVCTAAVRP